MESKFYKKAADYWAQIPPTVEGVLGGFGFISDIDVEGSRDFLESLLNGEADARAKRSEARIPPSQNLALDCGAGIGRITNFLLSKYFTTIDLVEQNPAFLEKAKDYVEEKQRLGDLYAIGLQSFKPTKKYDVIWCQWVLGHLKDDDLVEFFKLCRDSLNTNGLIIVKENVTSSNKVEEDDVDSSITRPLYKLLRIFKLAKLKRVKEIKQTNFPPGIYPVYMFALRSSLIQQSNEQQDKNMLQTNNQATNSDLIPHEIIENLQNFNLTNSNIQSVDSER